MEVNQVCDVSVVSAATLAASAACSVEGASDWLPGTTSENEGWTPVSEFENSPLASSSLNAAQTGVRRKEHEIKHTYSTDAAEDACFDPA